MLFMVVTESMFHELRSWFNAPAWLNMPIILVTDAVIHEPMGWLNARA